MTVLRLPTGEAAKIESIRQVLSEQDGVYRVDVDHLKRVVLVEYDSHRVSFDQLRSVVSGGEPRSDSP